MYPILEENMPNVNTIMLLLGIIEFIILNTSIFILATIELDKAKDYFVVIMIMIVFIHSYMTLIKNPDFLEYN